MLVVCVSSLVIAEIKRIVKESEIMKYETYLPRLFFEADIVIGRTTLSGRRRIATDAKSWRSDLGTSTYPLRLVISCHCVRFEWLTIKH